MSNSTRDNLKLLLVLVVLACFVPQVRDYFLCRIRGEVMVSHRALSHWVAMSNSPDPQDRLAAAAVIAKAAAADSTQRDAIVSNSAAAAAVRGLANDPDVLVKARGQQAATALNLPPEPTGDPKAATKPAP